MSSSDSSDSRCPDPNEDWDKWTDWLRSRAPDVVETTYSYAREQSPSNGSNPTAKGSFSYDPGKVLQASIDANDVYIKCMENSYCLPNFPNGCQGLLNEGVKESRSALLDDSKLEVWDEQQTFIGEGPEVSRYLSNMKKRFMKKYDSLRTRFPDPNDVTASAV